MSQTGGDDAARAATGRRLLLIAVAWLSLGIARSAIAYEGYADALTTGGDGGDEVWVTTLDDSGPGSLRDVVSGLSGQPTTIKFAVAGSICVSQEIRVTEPFVTIAGETAPPPGITLQCAFSADRCLGIAADDVIVRHLRMRNSPLENIQIWDGNRIIIDHCSMTWAGDGAVDNNTSDVIVSRCLIAGNVEASKTHGDRVSMHHNLFTNNNRRQVRVYDPAGPAFDFRNNYVTDWWNLGTQVVGLGASCNIVDNFYGPPAPGEAWEYGIVAENAGPFFTAGNVASDPLSFDPNVIGTVGVPFEEPDVTTIPADEVPDDVLADVGALPTDLIDQGWIDGTDSGSRSADWRPSDGTCPGTGDGRPPRWAEGADWYVDQGSGSDDNPGSTTQPFATIARAITAARAGDLVLVGAGTYVGPLNFTTRGGSSARPIRFKRDRRAGPVQITSGSPNFPCIRGTQGYITLDGFEITGGRVGIKLDNERADGWVIKNCKVYGNTLNGIEIRFADDTRLYNTAVYNNGKNAKGVYVYSHAQNTTIDQCTVYGHKYNVYFATGADGQVRDSIVNAGTTGVSASSATLRIAYSDVFGHRTNYRSTSPGPGTISDSPSFLSPARGDFHLAGGPCKGTASDGGDMGYRYGRY